VDVVGFYQSRTKASEIDDRVNDEFVTDIEKLDEKHWQKKGLPYKQLKNFLSINLFCTGEEINFFLFVCLFCKFVIGADVNIILPSFAYLGL